jgi:hypothetical protein
MQLAGVDLAVVSRQALPFLVNFLDQPELTTES